jgi:hypothetical protein
MAFELHVTGKKLGWSFCLKAIWIIVTVSILLMGLGTCLAGESPCFQAGMTMSGLMFFLSFPSCLLFVIWSPVIYGWETILSPTEYVLFWLGAFVVGYLQWFFLVPKLFESRSITSLGLIRQAPLRHGARRRKRHRSHPAHKLKPYDANGGTPLERVFMASDRQATNAFGKTWQSSTRRLPSRASRQSCNGRTATTPGQDRFRAPSPR